MRRRRGLADLGTRAEARVQVALALQLRDRLVIQRHPLGLPDDRAVPIEPERSEVGELLRFVFTSRSLCIQVLDPDQEARRLRPREQPRHKRRAQAAEMERSRRRRGEPAVGCHPNILFGRRDANIGPMSRLFEPIPRDRSVRRATQLVIGVAMYGATAGMLVLAGLGLDPWDVLHQGLSRTIGLGIGTWAIIVSMVVLSGWTLLRQRPGVGTLINAVGVGLVIDLLVAEFHQPHALWARILLMVGGVVGNGIATGLYIGAGLGPGARDGLTTGVASRGHSIRIVRTSIEATVLLTGFLLGGTVGIGTVFYALAIGPITHFTIPALAIDDRLRRLWSKQPPIAQPDAPLTTGS